MTEEEKEFYAKKTQEQSAPMWEVMSHYEKVRTFTTTIKNKFHNLKVSARQRKLSMDIDLQQYIDLLVSAKGKCFYGCGRPLPTTGYALDRKDSTKGYSVENVVVSCADCNWLRGHDVISHEEMPNVIALLKKLRGVKVLESILHKPRKRRETVPVLKGRTKRQEKLVEKYGLGRIV